MELESPTCQAGSMTTQRAAHPRQGEQYIVTTAFEAVVLTHWCAPFTGGSERLIPTATAVAAKPVSPEKWEQLLVDKRLLFGDPLQSPGRSRVQALIVSRTVVFAGLRRLRRMGTFRATARHVEHTSSLRKFGDVITSASKSVQIDPQQSVGKTAIGRQSQVDLSL